MGRVTAALLLALGGCAAHPEVRTTSDYAVEWRAAAASFERANVVLHEGLLADRATKLSAIVDAEDRLDDPLLLRLRGTTEEGAAHAEAAVKLAPDAVEGHLYLALNLAIYGLTRSHAAALLEGLPGKIRASYERAIAIDPLYAGGGAFRLKGKFLMSAPWPFRDYDEAGKALQRANEIAEVRENDLFLGDLRFLEGKLDDAVAMWRRVAEVPVHPETEKIDDAVLKLARRRLDAAATSKE
jgi:tetratricopeptide (TPR) repeat protein